MATFAFLRFCRAGNKYIWPKKSRILGNSLSKPVICKDIIFREMSGTHKRTMVITPSRFQYKKFKDFMHWYFWLGAIPFGSIMIGANLFIGPAELAEIPEGYEPENYEYYRDPIKRWFSRYIYRTDQEYYEKYLHFICITEAERQMKFIEKKVHELMGQRQDYKAWHYKEVEGKYHRIVRHDEERMVTDYYGQTKD